MQLRQWKEIVRRSAADVTRNHTLSFAAALSYYFVLSFFPALIALAAVVSLLPVPNLFDTIVGTMARVVPPAGMALIRKIVSDVITPYAGRLFSFGLVGTLWSASGGFAAMIEALNVAYGVRETRPIWKTRALALGLTMFVGTLVTIAFDFMIVGPKFGAFLASFLGLRKEWAYVWPWLRWVVSLTTIVLAIEGLYFLAPNLKQRFRATLPGAIFAVVGWMLLSVALSQYFQHCANLNKTYGVLGGGVALLTWLYWSSFVILLGAELNSVIVQVRGGTLALNEPPEKARRTAATTSDEAEAA
jgi:membrane protein